MGIEIKICGVTGAAAVDAALSARADYLGLVFHPASPRHVMPEQGAVLAARARGRVRLVALTADADDSRLEAIIRTVRPDMLQLHGRETPARAGAIRARFGLPIIKALAIATAEDFSHVAAYEQACDLLLFDAKPPASAAQQGGHGAAFDWRLLQGRRFGLPWMLAGGLTPDNVARAIATSGAAAVDVSSGVESAPGLKDAALIAAFAAAARGGQDGAVAPRTEKMA